MRSEQSERVRRCILAGCIIGLLHAACTDPPAFDYPVECYDFPVQVATGQCADIPYPCRTEDWDRAALFFREPIPDDVYFDSDVSSMRLCALEAALPRTESYPVEVWSLGRPNGAVMHLTLFEELTVAPEADPPGVAQGAASQLTANPEGGTAGYTFEWSPADSLDDPFAANPVATPTETTEYQVVVDDSNGDQSLGSVTVAVDEFVVEVMADPPIVEPFEPTLLTASPHPGSEFNAVMWVPPGGLQPSQFELQVVARPSVTTEYLAYVSSLNGVQRVVPVVVRVHLTAEVRGREVITAGESARLTATTEGGTPPYRCSWLPAIHLVDPTSCSTLATPPETSTYRVRIEDEEGDVVTADRTIQVVP